ncbi:MAG: HAD family hydrolase [Lachnospiraceae bacterium]|jgi:phosphoglycolate phosphatase|nr:HAD family hydrolase [Lachnospiraceae bacterium]
MEKQYLLFDLDGTLTDPMVGITKSVQYALRHYGIEEPDLKKLTPFIGPPLTDSFQNYYQFSKQQAKEAVLVYREYFTKQGILENEELPGIRQMLKDLKAAGKMLIVATSKPELFAKQIVRHFQFEEYFSFVCGADLEETRVRKGDVIRYALEQAGIGEDEKSKCVMIGDREHDMIGAKENGLESIGVLFGYGSREELEEAGADQIAADAGELARMLL